MIAVLTWLIEGSMISSNKLKSKSKAEHLYSALHGIQTTLKRSGMDHTVLPATNTMPAYLVSVHQMAPD